MNLTAAAEVLREFKTDPEFDSLDPRVRMAISKLVAAHPPTKAPKPIANLRSPEDAAWSHAAKKGATECAICQQPKAPAELEAMHCVSRRFDSLRPGFDRHSVLGSCCLRHDRTNGAAPGCVPCHRAIDRNAAAGETFWRLWFIKMGYPPDHFDKLHEESRISYKILPRRDVVA